MRKIAETIETQLIPFNGTPMSVSEDFPKWIRKLLESRRCLSGLMARPAGKQERFARVL